MTDAPITGYKILVEIMEYVGNKLATTWGNGSLSHEEMNDLNYSLGISIIDSLISTLSKNNGITYGEVKTAVVERIKTLQPSGKPHMVLEVDKRQS